MSNDNRLPPCDAEVFERGESVGLFDSFEKEDIERLCKSLSAVTGWRIDWSYFAGRPHVRALAPADQYPGLATAWFDPSYQEFITAQGREATLRIGDGEGLARYSVPLFTGAQAGEIVALRGAHLRAGEREHVLRTVLAKCKSWIESARDGVLYPIANDFSGVIGHNAHGLGQESASLLEAITAILPANTEPSAPKCETCMGESMFGCTQCQPDELCDLATWKRRAIEAESKLRTYDPQVVELGEKAMQALLADPKPNELVLTKCKLCDQLQADLTERDERIDTLIDDLEQAQYDKDAWKNEEESLWVQVFHGEGDDPFISAVNGAICIEQLTLIQEEIVTGAEDLLESGPGFYVLRCRHHEAHYDNVGMTEPAHWEIDFESYSRFPWADEAEAMAKEVQQDYPDCPAHAPDEPCPGCSTPGYTATCDKCIPY
ncbi:hypothetical protein [Pseudomonas monteilii]|uniref:hypothetical protein n=1 Tax=Pseudomonas monteilii TaxID=76759 RepID=UPI001E39CB4F|nr:hypothetical protein [Pseudomonas monteilii]MCE0931673.1 hypothetical protein [Pseudomonas monteilii]MCE1007503.1 hypothetical protein [Pseudomonas monteilii]WJN90167.1 hypothetical protein LU680_09760 [Pseudomonas monteilii]WJO34779.1 hypothetical protein LU690_08435 [Pseudomonas monteilii]WJR41124.1 hypothetical protein LU662_009010 [Pseudomonas monteilii]